MYEVSVSVLKPDISVKKNITLNQSDRKIYIMSIMPIRAMTLIDKLHMSTCAGDISVTSSGHTSPI